MNKIFISYSSHHPVYTHLIRDGLWAENLIPFIDKTDLPRGTEWENEIIRTIRSDCFALILVLTQEAVKSRVVKIEVQTALNNNKVVIPVLMERIDVYTSLEAIDPRLAKINAVNCVDEDYKTGITQVINRLKEGLNDWTDIEKIISLLGHFSSIVRARALKELAAKNDTRVIQPMLEALGIEPERNVILKHFIPALGVYRKDLLVFFRIMQYLTIPIDTFDNYHETNEIIRALGLEAEDNEDDLNRFIDFLRDFTDEEQLTIVGKLYNRSRSARIKQIGHALLTAFMQLDDDPRQIQAIYILREHGGYDIIDELRAQLATNNEPFKNALLKSIDYLEQQQQKKVEAKAKSDAKKKKPDPPKVN